MLYYSSYNISCLFILVYIYIYIYIYIYMCVCVCVCMCVCMWAGIVQSIVTRYGVDGQGLESWCSRDFLHPSRPVLGPTQPPIQLVPDLSRG